MFQRRNKPGFKEKFIGFFWPKIGWKRSSQYVGHRVARLPGTPYSIAAGFACGAAISFTPFVGLHLAAGALFAWAIRGSVLASWIGTLVGNPWTFPFIWIFIYRLGIWMGAGNEYSEDLNFSDFFEKVVQAGTQLDFSYIFDIAWPVIWPMVVGGIPCSVVIWIGFFFPVKAMVARYHAKRVEKHARAKRRRFNANMETNDKE